MVFSWIYFFLLFPFSFFFFFLDLGFEVDIHPTHSYIASERARTLFL